jgi:hypothetical protein
MEQTIKNTTAQLIASLPQEHVYYSPTDFRKAGFPEYLIERIGIELDRIQAESIKLPDSDWVDLGADQVQDAWDQFLVAIRAQARVPASKIQSLIELTLEDVLDQFTEPRNYMLDILIGVNQATLSQIQARKDWIVAYKVLVEALIRYMQRKNIDVITRDKAHEVLSHVDDKLTENHTPLKWAQQLEPVFMLLDNEVPSSLMIRYFTDRGMNDFAKWLGKGPDLLSRSSFIERISTVGIIPEDEEISEPEPVVPSPTLADINTQPEVTQYANEPEPEAEIEQEPVLEHETASETEFATESESEPEFEYDAEPETESAEPEFQDEDDQIRESVSLVESYSESDSEKISLDALLAEEEAGDDSLFSKFLSSDDDEETLISAVEEAPFDIEPEIEETVVSRLMDVSFDDSSIDEPEDTPPIIDASSDDEHVIYLSQRAKDLLDILEPNLETYIVEIFLNDDLDFYKHLENIASYDQWRTAGRYITRDIFDRNRIDLYSETAVMFTDAVQEFFDRNA